MAAGLTGCLSAVGVGCCVIISVSARKGVVRRPKVISKDFLKLPLERELLRTVRLSEISSEKSYMNKKGL